jgi:hypothetical protein
VQSVYKAAHTAAIASKQSKYRSDLDVSKLATELVRVPLLATLDNAALRRLAQDAHSEVHLPGSVMMRQVRHVCSVGREGAATLSANCGFLVPMWPAT